MQVFSNPVSKIKIYSFPCIEIFTIPNCVLVVSLIPSFSLRTKSISITPNGTLISLFGFTIVGGAS